MDDQEFFDNLCQMWAKTTESTGDGFWYARENDTIGGYEVRAHPDPGPDRRTAEDDAVQVADVVRREDAEFMANVHSLLPEIVSRTMAAFDSEENAVIEADQLKSRILELELEIDQLKKQLAGRNG